MTVKKISKAKAALFNNAMTLLFSQIPESVKIIRGVSGSEQCIEMYRFILTSPEAVTVREIMVELNMPEVTAYKVVRDLLRMGLIQGKKERVGKVKGGPLPTYYTAV